MARLSWSEDQIKATINAYFDLLKKLFLIPKIQYVIKNTIIDSSIIAAGINILKFEPITIGEVIGDIANISTSLSLFAIMKLIITFIPTHAINQAANKISIHLNFIFLPQNLLKYPVIPKISTINTDHEYCILLKLFSLPGIHREPVWISEYQVQKYKNIINPNIIR